ncbi:uncharacterized protein L3040_000125 [Drepanopeziza brunnea f. sp. 'multigermtubi']|uniref:Hard surface-induced protein n=1 Tax=Marssonina brunnea f. sp. multigermtubi (strain MB_m1) TaxID=1072389 RepID=K1WNS7_MARBU|nr:hard surface-induced protein [Drepanopeziza brunnea f. sp. 'multigermtubi' MB_m1]EKD14601.1 hard surface-induced protein [Drepanopeziza brunnea f. sp. 'multigermtubi' MB_m1]KAJ5053834.1 hypothetical protein L3040_000125 [Drepanopeziza brunnea f. sp. 'multigermtubi']
MDSVFRTVSEAWRDRHLFFAENHQATYQPLARPEELELPSGSNSEYDAETATLETSTALKEGYASPRSSPAWLSELLPRSERLSKLLCAILVILTPSWLTRSDGKVKKLHPTAWLDGLRGVASLLVVFHHSSALWYMPLNRGWHSSPEDVYFVQLPIIRLFYSGPAMVAIFFVVSGFSLSYKPLSLIRKGRYEEVLDSLSSSVLRRGLRLVIPPAFVTFFSMLFAYLHFYGSGRDSREPPQSPFFWEHLKSWYFSVIGLSDPFRPNNFPGGYQPVYDPNLWTIPVELHGSMVIFTTLLGLSRVRGPWRVGLLCGIVFYTSYYAHSHLFLFLSGVLLAELHHAREARSQAPKSPTVEDPASCSTLAPPAPPPASPRWTGTHVFWLLNLVPALWVLSMPPIDFGGAQSPGYMTLSAYLPSHYADIPMVKDTFWVFVAAFYLVFILDAAPFLQSVFTTRFAQYLGRISFALYICHGTFLYTLGWNLSERTLSWTGKDGEWEKAVGIALAGCVMYPLLFWTADVVAREVDARSVRWARWLQDRISVGW